MLSNQRRPGIILFISPNVTRSSASLALTLKLPSPVSLIWYLFNFNTSSAYSLAASLVGNPLPLPSPKTTLKALSSKSGRISTKLSGLIPLSSAYLVSCSWINSESEEASNTSSKALSITSRLANSSSVNRPKVTTSSSLFHLKADSTCSTPSLYKVFLPTSLSKISLTTASWFPASFAALINSLGALLLVRGTLASWPKLFVTGLANCPIPAISIKSNALLTSFSLSDQLAERNISAMFCGL